MEHLRRTGVRRRQLELRFAALSGTDREFAAAALPVFRYIEITDGPPQNLWEEYQKLLGAHADHFAMQRIANVTDIYPVFRELFRRRA